MVKRFKIIQYLVLMAIMLALSDNLQAQVQCNQGEQELTEEEQRILDSLIAAGVDISVYTPMDPNEIRGTVGYDDPNSGDTLQWVSASQSLPYTIYFENDPELATAAAQRVEIRHQFHSLGNLATFGIGSFGFGEHIFEVEGSPSSYQQRLDLTEAMGLYVDVIAGVDVVTNEAFWIFQSIDPATGLPPQGAEQGFLPINDENHSGEGFVTFTIQPKTTACSTRDVITASASIVFDVNEAISTNVWENTIDAVPPTTQLTGNEMGANELVLQFSGSDDIGGCGIMQYKLYVSDNYAAYQLYGVYPLGSEAEFATEYNHCYRFYCLGEDNVGNVEEMKTEPDFEYGNYNLMVSVAASPEEGGTVTGEGVYTYSSQVTVTATAALGYEFYRWTNNGMPVSEEPTYTFTILEDMNLMAQFVETNPEGLPFFVAGYGESSNAGWKFIASPIAGCIEATTVDNIFAATEYDLYYFDQGEDLEWRNYKFETFELENGQGYLYATKEDQTLVFRGTYNNAETQEVSLVYTEDNLEIAMRGWNLIGNPFTMPAYVDKSYYTMNEDGTAIEPNAASSTRAIPVCNGVMVKAETQGETVTFSRAIQQNTSNQGCLQIAVVEANTRGNVIQDKAIVSFNPGDQLGKFFFNESKAKVYIPQGGNDYSIATVIEKQGEIPLNFKTTRNGEYTISVNPDGADLEYLHLIDNLTGADIDLLHPEAVITGENLQSHTPSYTFQAKTTDYSSRFKLVFSVCEDADGDDAPFAFISNGNIIIVGAESDAMLQVVDVLGHVLVSTDVTRNVSTSGMAKGVYVLRLINGDIVKTQKIVIN